MADASSQLVGPPVDEAVHLRSVVSGAPFMHAAPFGEYPVPAHTANVASVSAPLTPRKEEDGHSQKNGSAVSDKPDVMALPPIRNLDQIVQTPHHAIDDRFAQASAMLSNDILRSTKTTFPQPSFEQAKPGRASYPALQPKSQPSNATQPYSINPASSGMIPSGISSQGLYSPATNSGGSRSIMPAAPIDTTRNRQSNSSGINDRSVSGSSTLSGTGSSKRKSMGHSSNPPDSVWGPGSDGAWRGKNTPPAIAMAPSTSNQQRKSKSGSTATQSLPSFSKQHALASSPIASGGSSLSGKHIQPALPSVSNVQNVGSSKKSSSSSSSSLLSASASSVSGSPGPSMLGSTAQPLSSSPNANANGNRPLVNTEIYTAPGGHHSLLRMFENVSTPMDDIARRQGNVDGAPSSKTPRAISPMTPSSKNKNRSGPPSNNGPSVWDQQPTMLPSVPTSMVSSSYGLDRDNAFAAMFSASNAQQPILPASSHPPFITSGFAGPVLQQQPESDMNSNGSAGPVQGFVAPMHPRRFYQSRQDFQSQQFHVPSEHEEQNFNLNNNNNNNNSSNNSSSNNYDGPYPLPVTVDPSSWPAPTTKPLASTFAQPEETQEVPPTEAVALPAIPEPPVDVNAVYRVRPRILVRRSTQSTAAASAMEVDIDGPRTRGRVSRDREVGQENADGDDDLEPYNLDLSDCVHLPDEVAPFAGATPTLRVLFNRPLTFLSEDSMDFIERENKFRQVLIRLSSALYAESDDWRGSDVVEHASAENLRKLRETLQEVLARTEDVLSSTINWRGHMNRVLSQRPFIRTVLKHRQRKPNRSSSKSRSAQNSSRSLSKNETGAVDRTRDRSIFGTTRDRTVPVA